MFTILIVVYYLVIYRRITQATKVAFKTADDVNAALKSVCGIIVENAGGLNAVGVLYDIDSLGVEKCREILRS
jgi:hypothetical protein